jgi:DNA invertase Pin-like site-specific DNA recombinase
MTVYGYARVSTEGQSLSAQVAELKGAGAQRIFQEKINGARTDRKRLKRLLEEVDEGDVIVTRLDRLARSTRNLLNILAAISQAKASFRSLHDAWADTTTPHGRLILIVLGGLAESREAPDRVAHQRRQEAGTGARRGVRTPAEADGNSLRPVDGSRSATSDWLPEAGREALERQASSSIKRAATHGTIHESGAPGRLSSSMPMRNQ